MDTVTDVTTFTIEFIDPATFQGGTARVGILDTPYSFEETVERITTLAGMSLPDFDPDTNIDDKVTIEFIGRFNGAVFTLYDYYGGRSVHIGADVFHGPRLDFHVFHATLLALLAVAK